MSAEDLGTRELGQVRGQRLDEFLATLRLLHNPSTNSKIGVPALDKLLANYTTRFDPTNLSAIPTPPIIEITSPGPKSGKTELLYWMIANLVLGSDGRDTTEHDEPRKTPDHARDQTSTDSEAQMEGDDTDLETNTTHNPTTGQPDHQIPPPSTNLREHHHTAPTTIALLVTSAPDITRLSQILLHHLLSSSPHLALPTAKSLVHSALSHIHIFQPTSLSSLIATVSSIPTYFLDPKNGSAKRRVGAIIIDSPSDYFWADKVGTQGQGQGQQGQQTQGKYPALASTLKRISTTLCTPIVFSTACLSTTSATSATSDTQASRPQLPSPFPTLPTLRLIISRHAIQGFNKDTDAETALKCKQGRVKAVREAGFGIRVNKWANEGQRDGSGDGDTAGFEVRINNKGVTVL
ncbi:hypothetical protein M436DRAFT_37848 [Aureobasidium namibiae CBS 147.97]|uniref:DNA recombination and repair protein Rad51-like C-terminal domain-containing protein n=1 Tax=Aureobasidium namibiae CBS 147.97 TaxID=1043004 RepID=A0A074WTE0_9PEZI